MLYHRMVYVRREKKEPIICNGYIINNVNTYVLESLDVDGRQIIYTHYYICIAWSIEMELDSVKAYIHSAMVWTAVE